MLVDCPGCQSRHLVADRKGWFGEAGSVEDFLVRAQSRVPDQSLPMHVLTILPLPLPNRLRGVKPSSSGVAQAKMRLR